MADHNGTAPRELGPDDIEPGVSVYYIVAVGGTINGVRFWDIVSPVFDSIEAAEALFPKAKALNATACLWEGRYRKAAFRAALPGRGSPVASAVAPRHLL